jgi:3-hydroxybutyryl-CoA dehydrogenase
MRILVVTDGLMKEEILSNVDKPNADLIWAENLVHDTESNKPDAIIDLAFQNDPARIDLLKQMSKGLVVINSVAHTLSETDPSFVRINAWPGFLKAGVVEASCDTESQSEAEQIFHLFNLKPEWLADKPGFISARIIGMIINEAFMALEENVSSIDEINTAMKLGTNYPFGPFEWADKIGIKNVLELLQQLAAGDKRYLPSKALMEKAGSI